MKSILAVLALLTGLGALAHRGMRPIPTPESGGARLRAIVNATNGARIELLGLDHEILVGLQAAGPPKLKWEGSFTLRVSGEDSTHAAIAGQYAVTRDRVTFTPAFTLLPGIDYVANVDLVKLTQLAGCMHRPKAASLELHARITPLPAADQAFVMRVYPTGDSLPANLLKFYIYFSQPMRTGEAMDHVALLDEGGRVVPNAFLDTDELWDRSNRRLTVLLDPGRIKRGLRPNHELGAPLRQGRRYRLQVDSTWRDANGGSLAARYEKSFVVVEPDRASPDIGGWRVTAPGGGTRDPIVIKVPDALDHALAVRMIGVQGPTGSDVAVRVTTADSDRTIRLSPQDPWTSGTYYIVVGSELEDLAGNTFSRLFDVDLWDRSSKLKDDASLFSIPVPIAPGAPPGVRLVQAP